MKKKLHLLCLCILMIFALISCGKEEVDTKEPETDIVVEDETDKVENGTEEVNTINLINGSGYQEEYNDDEYFTMLARVTYPFVQLYYGDEDKYPELNEALYQRCEETRKEQIENLKSLKEAAIDEYEVNGDYALPYEATREAKVKRADEKVVSIMFRGVNVYGGSGEYYLYGESYDTETGKKLTLDDVVTDKSLLNDMIQEQLDTFWDVFEVYEDVDYLALLEENLQASWTVDYNGLSVYFNPFAIGYDARGNQVITLSNEEYPELLKEEYQKVPERYGVEIFNEVPMYYDVTGDGKVDEIIYLAYESEEGSDGFTTIYINGEEAYDKEMFFYESEATFVCMKDGQYYLCAEYLQDSDYRNTISYSISDKVKVIDEIEGGMRKVWHEGGLYFTSRDVMTNPDEFHMLATTQFISTMGGERGFAFTEDGHFETKDDMYRFDEETMLTFTMLKDLEVIVCDEDAKATDESRTISKGEEVFYYGTDNEKYAYLKLSDGTICRVETDGGEWPITIDGIEIEEIFDGLLFAG